MSFDASSTDEQVLTGIDLIGKRVLITGASSGVGFETARVLSAHGALVIGTARDPAKAAAALKAAGNRPSFDLIPLDLSDLESVRRCTSSLVGQEVPFDVLLLNAGVMAVPYERTADGFESQFATNYLGHFLLANLLLPVLKAGSRMVVLSSAGHRGADVDLADPNFKQTKYDPLTAYRRSKTALILFALEFDRRHRAQLIRATAVHPGAVLTETARQLIASNPGAESGFAWKSVEQGAATPVWAGFVADADDVGGRYCEDCHVAQINDGDGQTGVRSYALDVQRAQALWRISSQMVDSPRGDHLISGN